MLNPVNIIEYLSTYLPPTSYRHNQHIQAKRLPLAYAQIYTRRLLEPQNIMGFTTGLVRAIFTHHSLKLTDTPYSSVASP